MSNKEKYNKAFTDALDVDEEQLDDLSYQGVASWDSVGHMGLVSELEDAFDFEFNTDDIIDFNSYKKGIELLKKYDIVIE